MFSASCSKPTITDGTVDPDDDTVVVDDTYTITCNTHYTLSGSATMTCESSESFDQTPICEGVQFNVLLITYELSFLGFLIHL